MTTERVFGKPYDGSADQPFPGMPEPAAPSLAERLATPSVDQTADRAAAVYEGLPEPGPEIELPAPTNPMAVARAILKRAALDGGAPYQYWRGEFYQHAGTHWVTVDKTMINKWLYGVTENAWYLKVVKGIGEPRSWAPDRGKIGNLAHAMSDGLLAYGGEEDRCIALQNGVYNLKTDRVDPHSPARFNLTALPFAYDKDATCPQWMTFLDAVLPGDREAQDFLSEWFGYILSGETGQHKMLSLVGPKRCGKGTIARVLEALLGPEAVTSPTLAQLGGTFGEESLIGRKLAVMSDVRWTPQASADATPVLLAISGGDSRDVSRKNRVAWHGYLGVRFMMMSNDPPNFRDASGALAYRMMQLHFEQTFAGKEDLTLTDKLIKELPGIFNWAIKGLHNLNKRGRFAPPASGEALAEEVRRMASPYQAFLDDFCEIDKQAKTPVPELLRAYGQWCRREGRTNDQPTTASLSRGLRTTELRIKVAGRQTLGNGQKVTLLSGVKLAVAPAWLVADGATEHATLRGPTYEQPPLDDEPPDD